MKTKHITDVLKPVLGLHEKHKRDKSVLTKILTTYGK